MLAVSADVAAPAVEVAAAGLLAQVDRIGGGGQVAAATQLDEAIDSASGDEGFPEERAGGDARDARSGLARDVIDARSVWHLGHGDLWHGPAAVLFDHFIDERVGRGDAIDKVVDPGTEVVGARLVGTKHD